MVPWWGWEPMKKWLETVDTPANFLLHQQKYLLSGWHCHHHEAYVSYVNVNFLQISWLSLVFLCTYFLLRPVEWAIQPVPPCDAVPTLDRQDIQHTGRTSLSASRSELAAQLQRTSQMFQSHCTQYIPLFNYSLFNNRIWKAKRDTSE